MSCSRQLIRRIDRELTAERLTWAQFAVLRDIDQRRGWTHAAAVGRRVGVSRQAASALLARLDARGFLEWMDEEWIKSVRLTPAGERALARAWNTLAETREAIERLSVEERRGLISAAESLRRELARRPARQPWYWEYLPAHLRNHSPLDW